MPGSITSLAVRQPSYFSHHRPIVDSQADPDTVALTTAGRFVHDKSMTRYDCKG